jgi:uncharacterized protein
MWSKSEPIYRIATHSTAKAWRHRLARHRLVGTYCASCGSGHFPGRHVCPKCHSRDLEAREFSKTGKVVCSAIDQSPLMGHGEQVPKPLAVIQLDDGPCVISDIIDCEAGDVKEGLPVEMVVRKWRRETNGNYMYGFKFRPVQA